MDRISSELLNMQDISYKHFISKLIPTVSPETIIGIRTPVLRRYAKELYKLDNCNNFLKALPHSYFEENNLHTFLIEQIKDFDSAVEETEIFLPYIDNWATCDSFMPPVFKKNKEKMLQVAYKWIDSDKPYTTRYGIKILMNLFLDENFKNEFTTKVMSVQSDEYYVNMMIAWFFATALAKQYSTAVKYLEENMLNVWVHNMTIKKAIESRRITKSQKRYLKTLKIKPER